MNESTVKPSLGTKLYYSIGEVADLTALPPYTLRSWEREFACLRPKRVRGKNRAYRDRDIAIILLIKRLLHDERYSTRGARQKLRNEPELIRGAVDCIRELLGDEPPSTEQLAAQGRGSGTSPVYTTAAEPPAPAAAAHGDAAREDAALRPLVRQLRAELQDVLSLLG